jgi:hypothetical protein
MARSNPPFRLFVLGRLDGQDRPQQLLLLAECGPSRVVERAEVMPGCLGELRRGVATLRGFIEAGYPPLQPPDLAALGERLFGLIMRDRVRRLYDTAAGQDTRLRALELLIEDPELGGWPWEFLRDHDRDFLCQGLTPVCRGLFTLSPSSGRGAYPGAEKARLLVVTAVPPGDREAGPEQELEWITNVFTAHLASDTFSLRVMEAAEPKEFARGLDREAFDSVHFYGHGGFDWQDGQGYLCFARRGRPDLRYQASDFAQLLAGRGVRLAFLNACESGRSAAGEEPARSSVAGALLARGVPGVIATQYSMPAASAHYLSAMIYNSLAAGTPLLEAVRNGRLAMKFEGNQKFYDWGIPVLYTTDPGLTLFPARGRPAWAGPFRRSFRADAGGALGHVMRQGSADGPAVTAERAADPAHKERARVRVALIDLDAAVAALPGLADGANEAQEYYHFQVVYLPAPSAPVHPGGAGGEGRTSLPDLEPFLAAKPRELDADRVCCLTGNPITGAGGPEAGSAAGWFPGSPYVLVVSTWGLPPSSGAAGELAAAVFRRCLALLLLADGRWQLRYQDEADDLLVQAWRQDPTRDPEQLRALGRILDLPAFGREPGPRGPAARAAPAPLVPQLPPLKVTVLRSGELAYTRDIVHGLRTRLQEQQPRLGRRVEFFEWTGPGGAPADEEGQWDHLVRRLRALDGDYQVGVGTQASLAIAARLGADLGKKPFLFLGVTYPLDAGLVDTLENRRDPRPIAGVGYGKGLEEVAAVARRLFPGRPLVFVYRRGIPQDEAAALSLKRTRLFREGVLRVKKTDRPPALDDLADPQAVYFSWYTFEEMFEDERSTELLRQRLVVATTRANVAAPGMAVAGVSPDDAEVGARGADLITRHALGQVELGSLDVSSPRFYYWINCDTARQRGLTFAPDVLREAKEAFGRCPEVSPAGGPALAAGAPGRAES